VSEDGSAPGAVRALAATLVLLAAAAPAPALAYVRTKDARTHKELFWPVPVVPFQLNRDWPHTAPSCRATVGGDPALEAVRASFAAWEQSCAHLQLVYGGMTSEIQIGFGSTDDNIVVFRRGWCSQHPQAKTDPCMSDPDVDCGAIYDCYEDSASCIGQTICDDWKIVALTSVLYDPDTGRIFGADVEVNGWDGVGGELSPIVLPQHGWYFTCYDGTQPATLCAAYGDDGCKYMDLRNTVTHEAGHFVGLAHAPSSTVTMFATTSPGELEKRSLSADDVAGVCAIYPDPSGGCGCGRGEGAGAASLLVASLALRRRRRAPAQTTTSPA